MFGTQLLYEAIYFFPMAVSMQLETVGDWIIVPSSGMTSQLERSNTPLRLGLEIYQL